MDLKGKWILITGASSGLGKAIAYHLAKEEKANLIVAARRKEHLEALKDDIEQSYGVEVVVVPTDLTDINQCYTLINTCLAHEGFAAAFLNAGATYFGVNKDMTYHQMDAIIKTNIYAVTLMCNQLTRHFEETCQPFAIEIVSSMSAFFPVPYQSLYSGTKAFVMGYANALREELTNKYLSITIYTPGGIATEMTQGDSFKELSSWMMPVDIAAKEAVKALKKGKYTHIPGFFNQLGARFMRILPSRLVIAQMARMYRNALDIK